MSPADHADLRRQNPKTTEQPLPQTNCLSLRDNAACCVPLRHLRHLRENIHPNLLNLYCSNETPEVSRRSRRFTQTNHKTSKQQNIKPQQPHELPRTRAQHFNKTSVEVS
ncbi:hypothetical protein, partial [Paenirhodobacter enshiensis]|uniref:hypothetical protein n=1 Tax=Paenirhodobacter enshiensis TaxID=1105367 RepID=UPI0035ADD7DE